MPRRAATHARRRVAGASAAGIAVLAVVAALAGCAPDGARELSGDLATHDPALVQDDDGTWYVYSTGNGTVSDGNIQIRSSRDGATWRSEGAVWDQKPAWIADEIPGVDNLWAPELYQHEGTWYLYYSASRFGKNASLIALATNTTLDPDDPDYEWVDRGPVVESTSDDDFNAIDPGIVEDEQGTPWLAFGSFWSGIRMIELEWPSGLRASARAGAAGGTDPVAEPLRLADRGTPPNAIEAPDVVEHEGDYFLFVSRDACCQGVKSTYNVAVGRAGSPQGPFVDRDGTPLLEGGGTTVIAGEGQRFGPGGQSVWGDTLALHYYDGEHGGAFRLALLPIEWDAEGWPNVRW